MTAQIYPKASALMPQLLLAQLLLPQNLPISIEQKLQVLDRPKNQFKAKQKEAELKKKVRSRGLFVQRALFALLGARITMIVDLMRLADIVWCSCSNKRKRLPKLTRTLSLLSLVTMQHLHQGTYALLCHT